MNHWDRVFITNLISVPFVIVILFLTDEFTAISAIPGGLIVNAKGMASVASTCVIGICISYFSWKLRACVSATSFALIGVLNKLLTMVIGQFIFHDSSRAGLLYLFAAILCGIFFDDRPKVAMEDEDKNIESEQRGAKPSTNAGQQ